MNCTKERIYIQDRSNSFNTNFDGMTIEEVQQEITEVYNSYKSDIEMGHIVKIRAEYYGYDGGVDYHIDVQRLENDAEYNKRMQFLEKKAAQAKKKHEQRKAKAREVLMQNEKAELEEYERLRQKFEKEKK